MAVKTTCVKFNKFDVKLNFKKGAKTLRLKVAKTGEISISLPFYSTQKSALNFLELHKEWLEKTHEKILANLPKDDEFRLLGKIYKIKIDESLKNVKLSENEILTPNLRKLEIYKKVEAKRVFNEFIEKFRHFIDRPINRVTIRNSKTRWGSCNSRKGYINLSLNLIQKEPNLIEYVVLHELTHLIYPHHQKSFYSFIANLMPDYRTREKAINARI